MKVLIINYRSLHALGGIEVFIGTPLAIAESSVCGRGFI